MPDDVQMQALLDEVDAIEAELRRIRVRDERLLGSMLQYVAGFGIAGLLVFEGRLVAASLGLGLLLPWVRRFLRRRRTERLEQRRDQLIDVGSLDPRRLAGGP